MAIEPDAIDQTDVEPRWDRHKHFPRHVTETARSLSLAGYTSSQIAATIESEHGISIEPRTIRYWRSSFPELSEEESTAISQANREIALTAQKLQLDRMTSNPDSLKFTDLVIAGGVAQDKELKRAQIATPPTQQNLVIILNSPPDQPD